MCRCSPPNRSEAGPSGPAQRQEGASPRRRASFARYRGPKRGRPVFGRRSGRSFIRNRRQAPFGMLHAPPASRSIAPGLPPARHRYRRPGKCDRVIPCPPAARLRSFGSDVAIPPPPSRTAPTPSGSGQVRHTIPAPADPSSEGESGSMRPADADPSGSFPSCIRERAPWKGIPAVRSSSPEIAACPSSSACRRSSGPCRSSRPRRFPCQSAAERPAAEASFVIGSRYSPSAFRPRLL